MKILKLAFFLGAITLTGCAHYAGYHRSYGGYGYGSYGAQGYYNYPMSPYYQPGGAIRYGKSYSTPRRHHWRPKKHYRPGIHKHPPHSRRNWKHHQRSSGKFGLGHNHNSRRDTRGSLGRLQHRPQHAPALLGEGRHRRNR